MTVVRAVDSSACADLAMRGFDAAVVASRSEIAVLHGLLGRESSLSVATLGPVIPPQSAVNSE